MTITSVVALPQPSTVRTVLLDKQKYRLSYQVMDTTTKNIATEQKRRTKLLGHQFRGYCNRHPIPITTAPSDEVTTKRSEMLPRAAKHGKTRREKNIAR